MNIENLKIFGVLLIGAFLVYRCFTGTQKIFAKTSLFLFAVGIGFFFFINVPGDSSSFASAIFLLAGQLTCLLMVVMDSFYILKNWKNTPKIEKKLSQ